MHGGSLKRLVQVFVALRTRTERKIPERKPRAHLVISLDFTRLSGGLPQHAQRVVAT